MKDIIRIVIAPLVWLVAFTAIYGLHGLLCGHSIDGKVFNLPIQRVLLGAAFLFAILIQIALLFTLYRPCLASSSGFVQFVSHATGWVGLVATLWSLFPVVMTTYCL